MVVMGASLIVSLNGTGNGFKNFVEDQFSSLGANVLILSPRSESVTMDKALADEIARIEGVEEVIPYIQHISTIVSRGEEQTSVVVGVDQSKLNLLFPTLSLKAGQTVKIKYQTYVGQNPVVVQKSFVVRGILEYVGSGVVPVDQMVFISTRAADNLFNRGGLFDGFYVVTESPELNEEVRRRLQERYGGDLVIISPQVIADMIQQITGGLHLFISVVAMVSLLVASVGIITTLQTSVMERIKEIGLLKALGFNRRLILALFLCEATAIGIIGGGLGVLLGVGLSFGMSTLLGRSLHIRATTYGGHRTFSLHIVPAFEPWNLLYTWILCIVLSMISGFYPSWRASRLDPVVALRHE